MAAEEGGKLAGLFTFNGNFDFSSMSEGGGGGATAWAKVVEEALKLTTEALKFASDVFSEQSRNIEKKKVASYQNLCYYFYIAYTIFN